MQPWHPYFAVLLCYLVGSFPTGVVLSLRRYGIDVRDMGSGNIGATNITRCFGWKAGVSTFLIDFMKGYLAILVVLTLFPQPEWILSASAFAVVLGHCYSVFLGFRGGKGVATTLGVLIAIAPWAGLLMAALYVTCLALTGVSAVGSLLGMTAAMLYVGYGSVPASLRAATFGMAFIVFIRHRTNFRRWFQGAIPAN